MTDFEKVYELLKQLGVEFAVIQAKYRLGKSIEVAEEYYETDDDLEFEIIVGDKEMVYSDSTSGAIRYEFDANGKIQSININGD